MFRTTAIALVLFLSVGQAHGDVLPLVWTDADTSGSGGWANQIERTGSLSLSSTGTGGNGETGTAFAAFSATEGTIKTSVATTSVFVPVGQGGFLAPGQANVRMGFSAPISLAGPQDVAGVVTVTSTFDGTWGGPGANLSFMQIQSGPGFDGIGFATSDPNLRGDFGFTDNLLHGQSVDLCNNCTYSIDEDFLVTVTASMPFAAGATSVTYAAQIILSTQGAYIDGSQTATFAIDVPDGFSYSSTFNFAEPIPEPSTWALMLAGGLATSLIARRRQGLGLL